jgi:Heavy metal associated domain 2
MEQLMVHKSIPHKKGVSHHLPHRTRYRLPKRSRTKEVAQKIRDKVSSVPGVKDVEVNERTGSVLISHDEKPNILPEIHGAMDSVALDLFEEVLEEEGETFIPGFSVIAHMIRKRVKSADVAIAEKTKNYLDLKSLVPLVFLGAGILRASKSKNVVGHVPALVLFYYAFDTYFKFHPPAPPAAPTTTTVAANGAPKKLKVSDQ